MKTDYGKSKLRKHHRTIDQLNTTLFSDFDWILFNKIYFTYKDHRSDSEGVNSLCRFGFSWSDPKASCKPSEKTSPDPTAHWVEVFTYKFKIKIPHFDTNPSLWHITSNRHLNKNSKNEKNLFFFSQFCRMFKWGICVELIACIEVTDV